MRTVRYQIHTYDLTQLGKLMLSRSLLYENKEEIPLYYFKNIDSIQVCHSDYYSEMESLLGQLISAWSDVESIQTKIMRIIMSSRISLNNCVPSNYVEMYCHDAQTRLVVPVDEITIDRMRSHFLQGNSIRVSKLCRYKVMYQEILYNIFSNSCHNIKTKISDVRHI